MSSPEALTIIFDVIALNSDKQSEFECDCANNGRASVTTNDFYKIQTALFVIGFFVDVFHFILQAMDTSSLNMSYSHILVQSHVSNSESSVSQSV